MNEKIQYFGFWDNKNRIMKSVTKENTMGQISEDN